MVVVVVVVVVVDILPDTRATAAGNIAVKQSGWWTLCSDWLCVRVGPQNSQRYGTDSSRLRQPVDGSTDTERDAGAGRQQQRNGTP